jgi:hypothetical protein
MDTPDLPWFEREADAFLGAPQSAMPGKLMSRVAARMRRRTKPDRIIENTLFGAVRHALLAAFYVGTAFLLKAMFGISVSLHALR